MDRKLSSRMVISPASFATSVPEPIAKPTSAFFSAGESFTPSPVMPTTRFSSCAQRTRRLLSVGSARDTTRRFGSTFLSSSSLSSASSALVRATSVLCLSRPASFAMATAVSFAVARNHHDLNARLLHFADGVNRFLCARCRELPARTPASGCRRPPYRRRTSPRPADASSVPPVRPCTS